MDELPHAPGVRRWFGSIDRTWDVIARTFGQRWSGWLGNVLQRAPDRARLDDHLAAVMAPWEHHEEESMARLLGRHRGALPVSPELTACVALARGLRHAMIAGDAPLPIDEARTALRCGLDCLLPHVSTRV